MREVMIWMCLTLIISPLIKAQDSSLAAMEKKLQLLSIDILQSDSIELKLAQNKIFSKHLFETLQKPESYGYPFDSLKTISILNAEDRSFRIFTWHIRDHQSDVYYGEEDHYYFGFVQRRYEYPDGKIEYIVIPLIELQNVPGDVENRILDNEHWLGAQYYKPKYLEVIPAHTIKRFTNQFVNGKQKKVKQNLYVLLGWNGQDHRSNYKVVETMFFDPENKNRIIFGSDIFYFDMIPKFRGVFNYSENAPFSLNYAYVKSGLFGTGKKLMIVYDHLSTPGQYGTKMQEISEVGPDGSYDALYFYKKRGYFEWYRNVKLAEKYNSKFNRKQIEAVRERERKELEAAGIDIFSSN